MAIAMQGQDRVQYLSMYASNLVDNRFNRLGPLKPISKRVYSYRRHIVKAVIA